MVVIYVLLGLFEAVIAQRTQRTGSGLAEFTTAFLSLSSRQESLIDLDPGGVNQQSEIRSFVWKMKLMYILYIVYCVYCICWILLRQISEKVGQISEKVGYNEKKIIDFQRGYFPKN